MRRALVALALTLAACERAPEAAPAALPIEPITLIEVPIRGLDSLLPERTDVAAAIDDHGAVMWFDDTANPLGTLVLDTTATPKVVRFGRRGNGPGELQNPWFVRLTNTGPLVFESSGRRVQQFSRSGAVLFDRTVGYVIGMAQSHVLVTTMGEGATLWAVRADRPSVQVRLSDNSDSTWRAINRRFQSSAASEPYAATMRNDTAYLSMTTTGELFRLVAGQALPFGAAVSPRIRTEAEVEADLKAMSRPIHGPRGELIRPAVSPAQLGALQTRPIRQTSPRSGLHIDGVGRLWRFRDANDGPVADVFVDTLLVQRVPLPCAPLPIGAHVAGRWLLLACLDTSAASTSDVVLRRFRF